MADREELLTVAELLESGDRETTVRGLRALKEFLSQKEWQDLGPLEFSGSALGGLMGVRGQVMVRSLEDVMDLNAMRDTFENLLAEAVAAGMLRFLVASRALGTLIERYLAAGELEKLRKGFGAFARIADILLEKAEA
ncbi:MAG: hypothetical protein Q8P12_03355 [bacterium]|nr:hypothetical protein [bacterium]